MSPGPVHARIHVYDRRLDAVVAGAPQLERVLRWSTRDGVSGWRNGVEFTIGTHASKMVRSCIARTVCARCPEPAVKVHP